MELNSFPSPEKLKCFLHKENNSPIVFRNQLFHWQKVPKTSAGFGEKYGSTFVEFRIVPFSQDGIAWEGNAQFLKATINDFIEWQVSNEENISSNPFHEFPKEKFWAYSSYNYMNDVFTESPEFLQDINWSTFGFPELTGKDSTIWIGSKGANTPCHVDCYGFNLVAQVLGRKKWILFPPEDSNFMYPTRIPYEESSIFSSVNLQKPDFSLHPDFKNTHPYVVDLKSGDILFVPKSWWHFVSNLDPVTISINTWIKLGSDYQSHLTESVSRALMTALIPTYEPDDKKWLNPKEELVPADETMKYIFSTLRALKEIKNSTSSQGSCKKVLKRNRKTEIHSKKLKDSIFSYENVIAVEPTSIKNLYSIAEEKIGNPKEDVNINVEQIINCFVHPEVVKLISQLLIKI